MSDEKRYGIIREQGEYMEPAYLTDDENAVIIAAETAIDDEEKE